jgi:hypothetical protein
MKLDCHQTIVSHMAYFLSNVEQINVTRGKWVKADQCFLTRFISYVAFCIVEIGHTFS